MQNSQEQDGSDSDCVEQLLAAKVSVVRDFIISETIFKTLPPYDLLGPVTATEGEHATSTVQHGLFKGAALAAPPFQNSTSPSLSSSKKRARYSNVGVSAAIPPPTGEQIVKGPFRKQHEYAMSHACRKLISCKLSKQKSEENDIESFSRFGKATVSIPVFHRQNQRQTDCFMELKIVKMTEAESVSMDSTAKLGRFDRRRRDTHVPDMIINKIEGQPQIKAEFCVRGITDTFSFALFSEDDKVNILVKELMVESQFKYVGGLKAATDSKMLVYVTMQIELTHPILDGQWLALVQGLTKILFSCPELVVVNPNRISCSNNPMFKPFPDRHWRLVVHNLDKLLMVRTSNSIFVTKETGQRIDASKFGSQETYEPPTIMTGSTISLISQKIVEATMWAPAIFHRNILKIFQTLIDDQNLTQFLDQEVQMFSYKQNILKHVSNDALAHLQSQVVQMMDDPSRQVRDLLQYYECDSIFQYCERTLNSLSKNQSYITHDRRSKEAQQQGTTRLARYAFVESLHNLNQLKQQKSEDANDAAATPFKLDTINFMDMDEDYAAALYRICAWCAARMFTASGNTTSYMNTLFVYGEAGAGKSYIVNKLRLLFHMYEEFFDGTQFSSPDMSDCTGRVVNEVRFGILGKRVQIDRLLQLMEGQPLEVNTKFKDKIRFGQDWPCIMTGQYPPPVVLEDAMSKNESGVRLLALVNEHQLVPGTMKLMDIQAIQRRFMSIFLGKPSVSSMNSSTLNQSNRNFSVDQLAQTILLMHMNMPPKYLLAVDPSKEKQWFNNENLGSLLEKVQQENLQNQRPQLSCLSQRFMEMHAKHIFQSEFAANSYTPGINVQQCKPWFRQALLTCTEELQCGGESSSSTRPAEGQLIDAFVPSLIKLTNVDHMQTLEDKYALEDTHQMKRQKIFNVTKNDDIVVDDDAADDDEFITFQNCFMEFPLFQFEESQKHNEKQNIIKFGVQCKKRIDQKPQQQEQEEKLKCDADRVRIYDAHKFDLQMQHFYQQLHFRTLVACEQILQKCTTSLQIQQQIDPAAAAAVGGGGRYGYKQAEVMAQDQQHTINEELLEVRLQTGGATGVNMLDSRKSLQEPVDLGFKWPQTFSTMQINFTRSVLLPLPFDKVNAIYKQFSAGGRTQECGTKPIFKHWVFGEGDDPQQPENAEESSPDEPVEARFCKAFIDELSCILTEYQNQDKLCVDAAFFEAHPRCAAVALRTIQRNGTMPGHAFEAISMEASDKEGFRELIAERIANLTRMGYLERFSAEKNKKLIMDEADALSQSHPPRTIYKCYLPSILLWGYPIAVMEQYGLKKDSSMCRAMLAFFFAGIDQLQNSKNSSVSYIFKQYSGSKITGVPQLLNQQQCAQLDKSKEQFTQKRIGNFGKGSAFERVIGLARPPLFPLFHDNKAS